ncbi:polyamine aminopropyltransferase [Emcibacter sp. SYSU 3D8]|uniref:polyamine aminopropyltransferase n=1 Tax=Emcibacter sp. SYSU 3D8 TaxID=3133969 RepID=UPI0031FED1FE
MNGWFDEDEAPRLRLETAEIIHESRSPYQSILVFRDPLFGRVLALDGAIQTTEADEFVYHEMMAHVPILVHGAARRVLIVGGGDGGLAEEVLKHTGVEQVIVAEIDAAVVEVARRHLPSICGGAFEDPRLRLEIGDAAEFIAGTRETFDVILVDSPDPAGPGEALFGAAFYRACRDRLDPRGILVAQCGLPLTGPQTLRRAAAALSPLFPDVACYLAAVPSYAGGAMAFGWAARDPATRTAALSLLQDRFRGSGIGARYYTPEVHQAAFVLPPAISTLLG